MHAGMLGVVPLCDILQPNHRQPHVTELNSCPAASGAPMWQWVPALDGHHALVLCTSLHWKCCVSQAASEHVEDIDGSRGSTSGTTDDAPCVAHVFGCVLPLPFAQHQQPNAQDDIDVPEQLEQDINAVVKNTSYSHIGCSLIPEFQINGLVIGTHPIQEIRKMYELAPPGSLGGSVEIMIRCVDPGSMQLESDMDAAKLIIPLRLPDMPPI